jgi:hypothetical protein
MSSLAYKKRSVVVWDSMRVVWEWLCAWWRSAHMDSVLVLCAFLAVAGCWILARVMMSAVWASIK